MSFYGKENLQQRGSVSPARPLATPGEAAASAWQEHLQLNSSLSAGNALYGEYETYRSQLHAVTGKRLFNPMSARPSSRAAAESRFHKEAASLSEQFPGLPVQTPDSIRARIGRDRSDLRAEAADVRERSVGFLSNAASFAATAGAAVLDPPVTFTLGLGAPWSAGVLTTALTEAAIGVGSEALVQLKVQSERRQFGEEADAGEAFGTIAAAGAGGFVLGGLFKGGVKAFKGTRELVRRARAIPEAQRTKDVDAAIKYLDRYHEVQDQNPFIRAALDEHMARSSAADKRMLLGGTAVSRVLSADAPIKLATRATDEPFGEPVEQVFGRAREGAPETFARIDQIEAAQPEIAGRIAEIDEALARGPSEVQIASSEIKALKKQLKSAKDPRKTKRLERKIAELEKTSGGNVARRAAAEASAKTKLRNEKAALNKELKEFDKELPSLRREQDRQIRNVEVAAPRIRRITQVKQIIGEGTDPVSRLARSVVDATDKFVEASDSAVLRPGSVVDEPVSPAAQASMTPLTPARQKTLDDLVAEQTAEQLDLHPDATYQVARQDGTVVQMSGREILDDFADDEAFLRELQDCVKGAL